VKLARLQRSLVVATMTLSLASGIPGSSAAAMAAGASAAAAADGASGAAEGAPGPDSGSWIVLLRPGVGGGPADTTSEPAAIGSVAASHRSTRAAAAALARATDLTIDHLESSLGFTAALRYHWAAQGFAAVLSRAQVAALRLDRSVSLVAPDGPASPAGPARQAVGNDVRRINAAPPSAAAAADADVDVAVIDTGIGSAADATLGGELNVAGGSESHSCLPAHPNDTSDGYGHGTHVAGSIAARDNDRGTVGVAPGARLHAVRVFDSQGQGSTATVICGIDWATHWKAIDNPSKPLVANMSLRGFDTYRGRAACDDPAHDPDPEHRAICAGVAQGVIFVVAAGNESADAGSYIPSRYPQVITVSAISDFDGLPGGLGSESRVAGCVPPDGPEKDDAFARYSNFGAVVDIAAPGTCVNSTAMKAGGALTTRLMSGTSMATPHVTGAVARYLALNPSTTPDAMRQLLISSGNLNWDVTTDPDGQPDRLLDVAALLDTTHGLAVWASPSRVVAPAGAAQRSFSVQLQRAGGFAGPVSIDITDLPAAVGTVSVATGNLDGMTGVGTTASIDLAPGAPDGDYPLTVTASGPGGTPTAVTEMIMHVDRSAPSVGMPWPGISLRSGGTFGADAPARLSWSASDMSPGVIAHVELQRRKGAAGTWSRLTSGGPARLSSDVNLAPGPKVSFRILATDDAGNIGTSVVLVTGLRLRESDDAALSWSSGWITQHRDSASGDSLRTSNLVGASADLSFSGRGIAWVAPTGHGKGSARVSIDGHEVGIVQLSSALSRPRHIVFASGQLPAGPHSLHIEVLTGSVDLDALLILR
jgi:subtilisin